MNKMVKCKTCGTEIAKSAKSCPSCGAKNKQPIYQKVWFWLVIVLVVIPVIGTIASSGESNMVNEPGTLTRENSEVEVKVKETTTEPNAFSGDCGIDASAEMGEDIIGYPELSISIKNTTDKKISAIQFWAVPCDVYGDEITGWTSQNKLYTDTAIEAGKSTTIAYGFIEDSVKTVKLYVYSVYFSDGTEWGDKEATKTEILNNAKLIEVYGES